MFLNETVSDEVEAYILGFLYADGYVTSKVKDKYYVVATTVSIRDEQIVIDMSRYFDKAKIKYKSNNCQTGNFDTICMQVCDVNLVERLIKLGLRPNKTYDNDSFIFDNIPDEFKHHFIRGYFDGDGTVGIYKNRCVFGIISCNKPLLESILNYLKNKIGTNAKLTSEKNRYFRIRINGNPICKKIEDLLYSNAKIFLKRKRDMFLDIQPLYVKKYKYKGIKFLKNKWQAEIYVSKNEQKRYLGLFKTELEAVKAYNNEARKIGKKEQDII